MNAPRDTSYEDELIQSLTGPAEAAAYLDAVMELEDAPALLLALRQVAKAQGMAETARHGLAPERATVDRSAGIAGKYPMWNGAHIARQC